MVLPFDVNTFFPHSEYLQIKSIMLSLANNKIQPNSIILFKNLTK